MKKRLVVLILVLLSSARSAVSSGSSHALDILLKSDSLDEREVAYFDILNNPRPYFGQIIDHLKDWKTLEAKNERALDRLIYLATFLKRDEFVGPLADIAGDPDYQEHSCIYDCPANFALAVYSLSKPWLSDGKATNWSLPNIPDIESLLRGLSLTKNKTGIDFARPEDQEALRRAEAMSEEELLRQASPYDADPLLRWISVEVLARIVETDKNIRDLYWLALEEIGKRHFLYRESIYRAILRAELARAGTDRKKEASRL